MIVKRLAAAALGFLAAVALPASAADQTVSFGSSLTYAPSEVPIVAGETVTFTPDAGNDFATTSGSTHHPLDFVDASIQDQTSGSSSVSRTFAQPGTFVFYCRNHGAPDGSGMAGRVIVAAAPAPSQTTTTTTSTSQTTTTTSTSTTPTPVSGSSGDTTAPTVTLTTRTLRGLGRHATAIRFTAGEAGRASASLTARRVVLARGTKTFNDAGAQSLTLKVTQSGRKLLRRSPRLKGRLQLVVRDAAGNTARLTRTVNVAR